MTENGIQIAVARADLIVCQALRVMAAVAVFAVILLAVLFLIELINRVNPVPAIIVAFMICVLLIGLIFHLARADPYYIPYDVTSEGPDGDYTAAWYEWKEEQHGTDMG